MRRLARQEEGIEVEHVYPASWMKVTAGCVASESREACRIERQALNHMEADLHNLSPSISFINQARSNYKFVYRFVDTPARTTASRFSTSSITTY